MFLFCSSAAIRIIPWLANLQPSDARRRASPPCQRPLRRRAASRDGVSRCTDRTCGPGPAAVDLAAPTDRRCGDRNGPPPRSRRAVERVGPLRAGGPNRVRRWLAGLRGTAAVQDHGDHRFHAQDHHPQRFAGHFFRPLDQPLSRLRARLHLLLRPPDPRLSRPVARARFRIEAVRQAGSAQAAGTRVVGAGLPAAHHRDRHQHRSVPADRTPASDHAPHPRSARALRPSGRHRDQISAGRARPRHPCPHGGAQSGQGCAVSDHARS